MGLLVNNFFKFKFYSNNIVRILMYNKIPLFVIYTDNKPSADYA